MSDREPVVDVDQATADPEMEQAKQQLELARERMLSAALAFCDGTISAGQLRAVRELLREQDARLAQLEGEIPPVFVEDTPEHLPEEEAFWKRMTSAASFASSFWRPRSSRS